MKSSVVSTITITGNGKYIIYAEQKQLVICDTTIQKCLLVVKHPAVNNILLSDEDQRAICFSRTTSDNGMNGLCRCITVPCGEMIYEFSFNIGRQKHACLTSKGHFLVVPSVHANEQVLRVYHTNTGTFLHQFSPKHVSMTDYSHIVQIPSHPSQIGIVTSFSALIWDIQNDIRVTPHFVRSIPNWNGVQTKDGKFGLNAKRNGLLEIIEISTGNVIHTIITAEYRQYDVQAMFSSNDKYVIHYHDGRKTVRLYNVENGEQVGHFYCQAKVTVIKSGHSGNSVVLGLADGRVVTLAIIESQKHNTDPEQSVGKKLLKYSASRNIVSKNNTSTRAKSRFVAVAKIASKTSKYDSKVCVVS